jgi:preprotein translocase subunit Sss1
MEGNFSEKIQILKKRKAPLIISFLFVLHLVGLLNTSDFQYGFHDLKIKLPVLLLPLLIGSSVTISEVQLRKLLLFFSGAVIASSICSTAVFFGIINYEIYDFRDISLFISHIRFALMVNLSIFCMFYYGMGGDSLPIVNKKFRILLLLGAFWLAGFLLILKSVTGMVIFMILLLFMGWKYSGRLTQIAPKFIIRVLIITFPLVIFSYISHAIGKYNYRETIDVASLDSLTSEGNPYNDYNQLTWVENGNYVWVYVCEEELRPAWNKLSTIDYDSKDKMGQRIKFTLIRYLTSKGFRKDAAGLRQLNATDIQAVENGVANYIFLNKYSIYPRVYQIIWEIDAYRRGNNPSGHSVTQRLAYLDAARYIVENNFVFGVGTGDVQKEFNTFYNMSENPLKKEYQRRAHNQFLTLLITFGLIGFIIALFTLLMPVFLEKRWRDYLFLCFIIIGLVSMLNEDTLETQTGVSFFMFFYSLLLFGRKREEVKQMTKGQRKKGLSGKDI